MGRYYGSSALQGGAGSLAQAFTTMTAGEAILANDLVVQGSDGKAYWATDPNGAYAALRPLIASPANQNSPVLPQLTVDPSATAASGVAFVLANGNLGSVHRVGGTIYFTAYGADQSVVVGPVAIATDHYNSTTPYKISAIALSGGGFAVAYVDTNTYPKLVVCNNSGGLVAAPANVATSGVGGVGFGNYPHVPTIIQLTGGNLVVFAILSSGSGFRIYSAAGAPQAAFVVLGYAGTSIAACGAGFAIGAVSGSSVFSVTANFYSATGTAGGTVTSTTTVNGYTSLLTIAAALPNGNAVIGMFSDDSTQGAGILCVIMSPTGTSVANNVVPVPTGTGMYAAVLVPLSDSSFMAFYVTSQLLARRVSAAGGVQGTGATTIDSSTGFSSASATPLFYLSATALPSGGLAVVYGGSGVSSKLATFTSSYALTGTPTSLSVSYDSASVVPAFSSVASPPYAGLYTVIGTSASGLLIQTYATALLATYAVGVAVAGVASGGTVQVQILGTRATRLTFKLPVSINGQANPTPSQKMSVVGNCANMLGVQ